ncbi:tRNA (N6-threonylcarbamoyladenosine(37)-N6)-methyltransferase TrmO [Thalassolituus sp. LLYu03]|uniref:tRNA (N6-threonylcarbamoyladenosine(37)-N6)-methyltransferase TrmO n=1 Tax=Thalassolituus sp. LLYu03 TaxID=3421656 RepID=UPI003D267270
MSSMPLHPVAIARTPFVEKFAIPRQPSLAPAARACIELVAPYNQPEALQGLEQVSHIWLLFAFHAVPADNPAAPRLRVRPPRLGGNEWLGVFATRSTHRPNGIGQSVVKLEKIEGTRLWVSGVDLLDGTPILDIKPYVPYADAIAAAHNAIAPAMPATTTVSWADSARTNAQAEGLRLGEDVEGLISQCLAQDPKPAYQKPEPAREYGVRLWDLNVVWHYPQPDQIHVLRVEKTAE